MRKTRSLTPALIAACTLVVVGGLTIGTYATLAAESPATDCLIVLQNANEEALPATVTCEDGAACDADGATNQTCTFRIRAVANLGGVTGCTPQPLKRVKVNPKKLGITVALPSGSASAEGAFADVVLALKGKNKDKPSKKRTIKAIAKAVAKKTKDIDKTKIQCVKCPTADCRPPTTTTTTTTNAPPTTLPTPPCGNGTVDSAEACDGTASPSGCGAGTFCSSTCTACQGTCTQLAFQLGAPTDDCGFPGQGAPATPPLSGELQDGSNVKITGADLGLGCLYIGGGQATIVPPGPTPNGSTTLLTVNDCSGNDLTLSGAATGNARTCTVGPSTTSKHCVNGHPGTDGQGACTQDSHCQPVCVDETNGDCSGDPEICHCRDGAPGLAGSDLGTCSTQVGCIDTQGMCAGGACGTCSGDPNTSCGCNFDCNGRCKQNGHCGVSSAGGSATLVCQPDPTCFFGSPLPINNTGTSTCVLNVVADGVSGTADVAAGTANMTMPLKSWVYLTGIDVATFGTGNACPICENNVCNAGPRKGLSCNTNSTLKVTHDCPPPDFMFLAPLDVALSPLTTEPVNVQSDGNGIFCQGPPVQATAGAFGIPTARRIIQNGSGAAGGLDATFKAATLASVFCIPATNNILIDNSANLPGPGSTALAGSVRLQ